MKMKLKFFSYLSGNLVRSLCIKYDWCTRMTTEDFNAMLALADSIHNDNHNLDNLELTIEKIARSIKNHSVTEFALNEIAGEIYRNAVVRFVDNADLRFVDNAD